MNPERLLRKLESGQFNNVAFRDVRRLMEALSFRLARTSGSHNIYSRADVQELINLQETGGDAKPYQLRQLVRLLVRYDLTLERDR